MVAPHARHHRRHAVKRPFLYIGPFDAGKVFAREDRVGVAEQDRIDARDLTQVVNGVFCHGTVRIGGEARVGDNDHQIGAFSRISGTYLRAVSVMSLTVTLPSRLALSHVMICGGTKPI